jgi:signal transduction histidine kinase/HAMP domain-containing protein
MLLPGWLNLDSLSIIRLAALLLSLVIAAYLFLIRRKARATLFLAGAFAGAFLFNAASFFEFAGPLYWQPRTVKTVVVLLLTDIGPSLTAVFLLLFSYFFPRFRQAEKNEFRIVLASSIILNTGVLGLNVYDHFILQWLFSDTRLWDVYWTVFYGSLAVQFLGVAVLLLRKAVRLSGHESRPFVDRILRPQGRDAEASRALGLIILLPMVAVGASLAVTYGVLPFSLASYLTWLGLLLFYLAFVVTYLNHAADPLTLPVKLLGVTLVLILSTMGLVGLFVGETSVSDFPRSLPLPQRFTIRFALNASRSYDISSREDAFDQDLGERLHYVYGQPFALTLEFDFPFFTSTYRVIHVLNGPMIYLGEKTPENGWGGYNPQPVIAPLIMNLDPSRGGGIHVKSSGDSATITWFRLPELGAANANTVQLVLRRNGAIVMSFPELSPAYGPSLEQLYDYAAASTTGGSPARGRAPAPFPPRLTGIHPGGGSVPLTQISFTRDLPWTGNGPAVIFESHEAGLARHLNARIAVLAALTIGASLFVGLLFPLLLRTSLFIPLRALSRGMHQVEAGDLETVVKAHSRDEIGLLAASFNGMVESLRRAESSFRALAEDAQDGIIVFRDETAVYANRRAVEMTGYSMAEMTQTAYETLFRSAGPLPAFGVQPDAPTEAFVATAGGPQLPVELVYSRTLWHGRTAVAVLMRDITRRKREESMLEAQRQSLMRMDKLTSLGVLAAGLAHEISAPNQVILSNATLLSRASPQMAASLEAASGEGGGLIAGLEAAEFRAGLPGMLSAIRTGSALIDGIIRNLRDFSADSPGRGSVVFDVNTAVRNAVDLVAAYIRKSTDRFTLELQPGRPRVRGSAQRLEQVFINLILNSCQSLRGRDKAVTVRSSMDQRSLLRIVVSDQGQGIPADILPRVRDAFFTTREATGGTGLGLHVSQAIVTAHGGTLEISSTPGVGTEVTVTLPVEA